MLPRLNLVVLRSHDLEAAERFYAMLGLRFGRHRPVHLCSEGAGLVFEVYPSSEEHPSTAGARLGFEVDDLGRVVEARECGGAIDSDAGAIPLGPPSA